MRRRKLLILVSGGMGLVAGCPSQSNDGTDSMSTPTTTATRETPSREEASPTQNRESSSDSESQPTEETSTATTNDTLTTEWTSFQATPRNDGYIPISSPVDLSLLWTVRPEMNEEYQNDSLFYWSIPTNRPYPTVGGGRVYASRGARLYAFDPDSGEQIWEFEADNRLGSMGTFYDGHVYIRGTEHLYGINAESGEQRWQTNVSKGGSVPTIVNEILYIGGAAHDVTNGVKIWESSNKRVGRTFAPTYHDGTVIVWGISGDTNGSNTRDSNNLYGLDAKRGGPQWSQKFPVNEVTGYGIETGQTPVISGGRAIIAAERYLDKGSMRRAELWILSHETDVRGKLFEVEGRQPSTDVSSRPPIPNPLAATPETVYLPTHIYGSNGPRSHVLYAVDSTSGSEKWNYSFDTATRTPAVTDDAIYVPSGKTLFVLNLDGTYATSVNFDHRIGPPLAVTSEKVYVPDKSGALHALAA